MGAETPNAVAVALRGSITRADLPRLLDRVCRVLRESGAHVVVCDVAGVECDAVTVDALARFQLEARRNGCQVRLRGACPSLVALVDLMGLGDVLLD
jgi:ABC-type transporter Mla MlaB component